MYCGRIKDFCSKDWRIVYSEIDQSVDNRSREGLQKASWNEEIKFLQACFSDKVCPDVIQEGHILFEYYIPRLGKRPDVILLINGIVFVLEFKVGEEKGNSSQKKQTVGYAEALKYFHNRSWYCTIVPVLVATKSRTYDLKLKKIEDSGIYSCLVCNKENLINCIKFILDIEHHNNDNPYWAQEWIKGQYDPNPSIIEATLKHYNSHGVEEIRNSESNNKTLCNASDYILSKITETKRNNGKAIFFVTGVPGAGKTLVGLEVVSRTHKEYKSVFLSGNDPLVKVLSTALTKDTEQQEKYAKKIDPDTFSGELYKPTSMVQIIHGYRKATVEKIDHISDTGELILKKGTKPEIEHVVVFDEAQRAWTRSKLQSPGRTGKTTCLQDPNFPYSEPGFLIWSMDQHKEWSVIICLVGGGQEINTGEAGITEWFRSLRNFPDWKIYMSKELNGKEYGGNEFEELRTSLPNTIEYESNLHLAVSRRSIRSNNVSAFVEKLLDGNIEAARKEYAECFKNDFQIVLTRDLDKAKLWVTDKKNSKKQEGRPQRAGMLMSSKAFRLRPYGFEPKIVGEYDKVATWFLGPPDNTESSDFLEVALSEFFVQGLELDWTVVMWDADFRVIYNKDGSFKSWDYYWRFDGNKWSRENKQQIFHLNAYRVLLTRARRGMVLFIPKGDENDHSRNPEWYNGIYNYLKSLGIKEI